MALKFQRKKEEGLLKYCFGRGEGGHRIRYKSQMLNRKKATNELFFILTIDENISFDEWMYIDFNYEVKFCYLLFKLIVVSGL